jgi:large subunit ribosomal protein L4
MSNVKIFDIKGSEVGDYDVPAELLELEKGTQAVHDVVVAMNNARRAGTACTLEKGEVAGTGAKPWKQKGTGRARAGYRQSTVWRGGATTFGPRPRLYLKKVNKKITKLAFRRALSEKLNDGEVRVVEQIAVDEAKTKQFKAFMQAMDIKGPALVVVDQIDQKLRLASRNVPRVELVKASDVNVYQLLRYPSMIVNSAGMDQLKARLENKA